MGYKLAIFDLDGTILDTLDDLADSLNCALQCSALPERTRDEVRRFVGNGIRKLIERAVPPDTAPDVVEKVFADFTEHYRLHCSDKTKSYDGIPETLSALRKAGIKTAVVSNKADYAVQILCEQYFHGMFDIAVGEKTGVRKKPMPDSVSTVLEQLQIRRADAIYIGDSEVDIQTAKNADMDCLLVSWGFRGEEFLHQNGARKILHTPAEIFPNMIIP
ncbi:MAG: HAD-IA family hydrolase [Clostridiales bacterium]|nr:HAD-IA family hydrolase [Clostridiales bacterium]